MLSGWRSRVRLCPGLLVVLLAASVVVPRCAQAQPVCPDTDGDGVCDDVDNCPTIANPGQENTFGGLEGDACETLNVVKLKIKTGTAASPKGKISAKGNLLLPSGTDLLGTSNVTLRVIDGFEIDVTAPAQDAGNPDGILCDTTVARRIRCRGAMPQVSAVFKFGVADASGARLVSWTFKIAKLATSQIPQEPVTVILTDVVQDEQFAGVIHDCFPRNGKLTCKEF
jgi:hypothetical protein